jgi:hypothetical protein
LLAAKKYAAALVLIWGNFTTSVPRICFEEFMRRQESDPSSGQNISLTFLQFLQNQTNLTSSTVDIFLDNEIVLINTTELYEWMDHCGDAVAPITRELFKEARVAAYAASGDLTFNWIRCDAGDVIISPQPLNYSEIDADDGGVDNIRPDAHNTRPEAQERYYTTVWNKDQKKLYEEYLEDNMKQESWVNSRADAFSRSLKDASGADGCTHNVPASGKSRAVDRYLLSTSALYEDTSRHLTYNCTLLFYASCYRIFLVYHYDYYRLR